MQFRLIYQGKLTSNGSVDDKFAIRRQLHPQLRRLWEEHPLLHESCAYEGALSEHQNDSPNQHLPDSELFRFGLDVLADTHLNGFRFLPLARERWHIRGSIDILFLRRENPGGVFMRGDIDNRLKTLFDALQMPHSGQEVGSHSPLPDEDPFFVLMEEDKHISDVSVTTDRLLDFPAEHEYERNYAVLVIDVKLLPTQPTTWSRVFALS